MKTKVYNIFIGVLAVVSVAFVVLDLSNVINLEYQPFKIIDTIILLIFVIDYSVRFFKSDNRKKFFKGNIFDLIAIIPFNTIFSAFRAFRIFRILKVTKLSKLTRVIRATAFLNVIKNKISGILKTNGLLYLIYTNIILILISAGIMVFAEKMTFMNAVWWCIVTCTTVGYGDISPTTLTGRGVAVVLMVFGIGLIGMLTGAITTYFTQKEPKQTDDADKELLELIDSMTDEDKEKLKEIAKILNRK